MATRLCSKEQHLNMLIKLLLAFAFFFYLIALAFCVSLQSVCKIIMSTGIQLVLTSVRSGEAYCGKIQTYNKNQYKCREL